MTIELTYTEITQKTVRFAIDGKEVEVSLTKEMFEWNFSIIRKEKELTVKELTEICKLIYSEGVLKAEDCIRI